MKGWLIKIFVLVFLVAPLSVDAAIVTFLTSGTSYSTPADWNNSDNSIECIGSGGTGATGLPAIAGGGGGGAYAKITNLTIAGSIAYAIASGGSQADTTFNTTSLICDAGNNAVGTTGGTAGLAANSTGSTKFNGGAGSDDGGGGGAGGTTSAGNLGAAGAGGDGGTVSGGLGGPADSSDPGGDGTVWQVSPARGAGGGGGSGTISEFEDPNCVAHGGAGGGGGLYGGGGGGGANGFNICAEGPGGVGAQGIVVTTYTPAVTAAPQAGLKIFGFSLKIVSGGIKILR